MQYLASHGEEKSGNDVIFSCFARYQNAASAGADAVNGTVGRCLRTMVHSPLTGWWTTHFALRLHKIRCLCTAQGLAVLPRPLDFLGTRLSSRRPCENGPPCRRNRHTGGFRSLVLAAANFAERGDAVLLRDRHWGPYAGFLKGCGLEQHTYPLLPRGGQQTTPMLDLDGFTQGVESLATSQSTVMTWLNDPAHNPTGLSLPPESRSALLNAFMESATRHEHVGHTLLIDAAYHMYAEEPHGWAQTLADALDSGVPWPENLLICFAISLSKSHTIYGMRTGALVYLHPERGSIDRLQDVMGVTGRQTWSAAPRVAQHVLSELHATAEGEMHGHWNATGSQHFF